jgi:anti-sigma B factor antagonist
MRAGTFTAFDVETVFLDSHVELRLAGELDIGTAGHFRHAFQALDKRARTVVVDLSALTFIDSTGLHELVVAHKALQASGGQLVLQSPSTQTRRVLEIVGLDRLLSIR